MQVTATLAAVALATTALASGVAGAAIHAATATVRVECPASLPASADDLQRFMSRPAPPITGGRQF